MQAQLAIFAGAPSRSIVIVFILCVVLFFLACMFSSEGLALLIATSFGSLRPRPLPVSETVNTATHHGMPRLRFSSEGTFKISVLEDLHFGEAPDLGWGAIADRKSQGVIRTILEDEVPNFAVLNGDLITGENTYLHNATHYLDQIVEPLVAKKLPWASTYGNHDQQFNLSSERLLERERTRYPDLSYTRSMVRSSNAGVSNFFVPIYSAGADESSAPAALLWFFDSKGGSRFLVKDPKGRTPDDQRVPIDSFVDLDVVDWFQQTNSRLVRKHGRPIPAIAFVHIPIFAMAAFQHQGIDPKTQPGINDDDPLSGQSFGPGGYMAKDVPFMKALVDAGVKAVFSGHDHGDDWCFQWRTKLPDMTVDGKGMFACFGRHTGYGGYGNWTRGSRQILLHETTLQDEIATWIRLEDSSISGSVVLNRTYGSDIYPVVRS